MGPKPGVSKWSPIWSSLLASRDLFSTTSPHAVVIPIRPLMASQKLLNSQYYRSLYKKYFAVQKLANFQPRSKKDKKTILDKILQKKKNWSQSPEGGC